MKKFLIRYFKSLSVEGHLAFLALFIVSLARFILIDQRLILIITVPIIYLVMLTFFAITNWKDNTQQNINRILGSKPHKDDRY